MISFIHCGIEERGFQVEAKWLMLEKKVTSYMGE